jgi:uncharacterized protein (TIGR02001 family)
MQTVVLQDRIPNAQPEGKPMPNPKLVVAAFAVSAALPALALAQDEPKSPHSLVGNATLATDYVVRGLTQTNSKPAVQATLEYNHTSGFYAGLFGSNVSWYGDAWEGASGVNPAIYGGFGSPDAVSNSIELDFYLGFRNKFAGDFSYDFGGIYYYYPGKYNITNTQNVFGNKKPDTGEVYAGLGWKWITAKVYYAVTEGVFGVNDANGSIYGDLTGTFPIGESGFNLIGHVGYWKYNGAMKVWNNVGLDNSVYDNMDWKLGVTKDFLGLSWGLYYTGTNAAKTEFTSGGELAVWGNRFGKNVGDERVFLTVSKVF